MAGLISKNVEFKRHVNKSKDAKQELDFQ